MKKLLIAISLLLLVSCGGSLSDEQKQKIREDMEQHKIVKVTDAEITEGAFNKGRQIMDDLKKIDDNSMRIDSVSKANQATIKWLVPGATNALEIERQLVEAYLASAINGGMEDNVQRLGSDSLIYTSPVTEKLADGSENVKGIWSIRLSKKALILEMTK